MNLPFFFEHCEYKGDRLVKTGKVFFYSDQLIDGINFRHYLSPGGWTLKYTTFNNYDEGKKVFDKIGQAPIPAVPQWRVDQEKECKRYLDEERERSFHEYMKKMMDNR